MQRECKGSVKNNIYAVNETNEDKKKNLIMEQKCLLSYQVT